MRAALDLASGGVSTFFTSSTTTASVPPAWT
jgi:hypothetical protein